MRGLEPMAQAEAVVHRQSEGNILNRTEVHGHGQKLLSKGGIFSISWRCISMAFKAFHLIQSGPLIVFRIILLT